MRPCGAVNTVGVTRITVGHLLPERTTSLAGLSGTGKISIGRFFFSVTQLCSFFHPRGNGEECPRGIFKFDGLRAVLLFALGQAAIMSRLRPARSSLRN